MPRQLPAPASFDAAFDPVDAEPHAQRPEPGLLELARDTAAVLVPPYAASSRLLVREGAADEEDTEDEARDCRLGLTGSSVPSEASAGTMRLDL